MLSESAMRETRTLANGHRDNSLDAHTPTRKACAATPLKALRERFTHPICSLIAFSTLWHLQ